MNAISSPFSVPENATVRLPLGISVLNAIWFPLTVPSVMGGIQRYELLTSGQQVVSTIRAARTQAVARNQVLKVRFNFPAAGQYQVVDAADAAVGQVQTLSGTGNITFGAFTDVQFTTAGRLAAPIVIDSALFLDLAKRAGMSGIQEWLSFYFKAPMHAKDLYPEHDLFIQLMKLKNTLRYMMGEEMITHLGREYYD